MPFRSTIICLVWAFLAALPHACVRAQALTTCATTGFDGQPANNHCSEAALSADGRYIVFTSAATNLVSGAQSLRREVFRRDLSANSIARVSTPTAGGTANAASYFPAISADGRFVAFTSDASNLIPGDTNNKTDVFLKDFNLGTLERVSIGNDEAQSNGSSYKPAVSADGRFVAFWSLAGNLVADDTNNAADVFVRDRYNNATERISVSWDPAGVNANQASNNPVISADGRFVAFLSLADNIVQYDTNGVQDVFVRDRLNGITIRASVSFNQDESDLSSGDYGLAINGSGRFVTFSSFATNLVDDDNNNSVDIFTRDLDSNSTYLCAIGADGSHGASWSQNPAINYAGDRVVFNSGSTNLVPNDTNGVSDVFVRQRSRGWTERASVTSIGLPTTYACTYPAMSADGRFIAFEADARAFIPDTTVTRSQIFVRGPLPLELDYSMNQLGAALRIAGGLRASTSSETLYYSVAPDAPGLHLDLLDAVRLCRAAAGLDPKP